MKQETTTRQAIATLTSADNNHSLTLYNEAPFVDFDSKPLAIVLGRGKALEKTDAQGEKMTATTYDGLCYINNKDLTDSKTIRFNYTKHEAKEAIEKAIVDHYEATAKKPFAVVYDYPSKREARSTKGVGVVLYDTTEAYVQADKTAPHITADTLAILEDYEVYFTYDLCTARAKKDLEEAQKIVEKCNATLEALATKKATLDTLTEADFLKKVDEARQAQNEATKEAFPDKFKTTKQKLTEENEDLKRQLEEMKKALAEAQAKAK